MQAEGIPWAVIAVDSASPNDKVLIYEIQGWNPSIRPDDRDYLDAILADWKTTLNKDGDGLLESLSGLVIGPLRASASGQCAKAELDLQVRALNEKARN